MKRTRRSTEIVRNALSLWPTGTPLQRMALLLRLANTNAWVKSNALSEKNDKARASSRRTFNSFRDSWKGMAGEGTCWACANYGQRAWHHIIQLQHGGQNRSANTVRICEQCHAQVHPWMAVPSGTDEAFYREARSLIEQQNRAEWTKTHQPRLVKIVTAREQEQ